MSTLTAPQQAVLNYLQSYRLAKGFPPTRSEIARQMGWKSANAAQDHLQALAKKGVIQLFPGEYRGIRIIPTATETLVLPKRTPLQLQALEVRKIWDSEGCHSAQFPEALTALLDMVLS